MTPFLLEYFTAQQAKPPNPRNQSRNPQNRLGRVHCPKPQACLLVPSERLAHDSVNQDTAARVSGRPEPKALQLGTSRQLGGITGGSAISDVVSSRDQLTSVCIRSWNDFSRHQPKRSLILVQSPCVYRGQRTRRLLCPSFSCE